MNQLTLETRQPEPQKILVESNPVEEGKKLEILAELSWEDLRGLTWILKDDYD
jgi:hypothetical protein